MRKDEIQIGHADGRQALVLGMAAAAVPAAVAGPVAFGPLSVAFGAVLIAPAVAFAIFLVPPLPAVLGLIMAVKAVREQNRLTSQATIAVCYASLGSRPGFFSLLAYIQRSPAGCSDDHGRCL